MKTHHRWLADLVGCLLAQLKVTGFAVYVQDYGARTPDTTTPRPSYEHVEEFNALRLGFLGRHEG